MHEIVLIEDGCCHAGEQDDFVAYLEKEFEGRATVVKYGVGGALGFSAVPAELSNRLLAQGAKAVPVLAVDGNLLFNGEIPERERSVELIEAQMAEPAEREVAAQS
ncbi:MAG TPA: hypothetical protein VF517_16215 [Thermoleophilaceae bacterium]|jgi:hypothetical protein